MTDYRPGDVYFVTHDDDPSNITYAATLVGAQPVWSDDSDATRVDFGQRDPVTTYSSQARANFAPVPPGTYYLQIRAEQVEASAGPSIGFQDAATTQAPFVESVVVAGLDWYSTSSFVVSAEVAASPMVFVNDLSSGTGGASVVDLRVYEVILRPAGAAQFYRAPQRLYPRSDARRWPPPGSTQASPRRVGGYR